jgi:hypothetical protein
MGLLMFGCASVSNSGNKSLVSEMDANGYQGKSMLWLFLSTCKRYVIYFMGGAPRSRACVPTKFENTVV